MKVFGFIPARLESRRFSKKVIKKIFDLPMIEHVRRRAIISKAFDKIYVVTNSVRVKRIIKTFGGNAILTKYKHFNGTSRVSEISNKYNFNYGFILFGDEPFINPKQINECVKKIKRSRSKVFNVITNLKKNDINSSQIVKAKIDKNKFIVDYFRIEKKKNKIDNLKKSSGILILSKHLLNKFKYLKVKQREKKYKIEQFRFLENNIKVKSIYIKNINPSINTKEEWKTVISNIKRNKKEMMLVKKVKNLI
tara:strand:+ start:2341 stop:3093 length:753 start_codon:yes stop_codon:yes gene_type:complete